MLLNLHNGNGKHEYAVNHGYKNKVKENSVVSFTYAGAEPQTVMIEDHDTVVTIVTMRSP
jgi:hypothetical protein